MKQCAAKTPSVRFSVLPENEARALAHFKDQGFYPTRIEMDAQGLSVLIFPPMSEDQALRFTQAFPTHLSTKIGIVSWDKPPIPQ